MGRVVPNRITREIALSGMRAVCSPSGLLSAQMPSTVHVVERARVVSFTF